MKCKILFLLAIALCSLTYISEAQPIIEFDNINHDFDKIPEGSLATHEFRFTNTGKDPLVISNVKAACGCTTPYWTKDPVMPGKQGVITASYNSKGRPGTFNKSITVNSNASQPNTTLSIKGVVVDAKNIQKVFSPQQLANSPKIELSKIVNQLGKMEKGQAVAVKMNVKNNGKTDLLISGIRSNCNCITLEASADKRIEPGKTKTLSFVYKPRSVGKTDEVVTLFSNDLQTPEAKFTIVGEVVETLNQQSLIKENNEGFKF